MHFKNVSLLDLLDLMYSIFLYLDTLCLVLLSNNYIKSNSLFLIFIKEYIIFFFFIYIINK